MTKLPPAIAYCANCGAHLIRKHTVLLRRDDTEYAVYRSFDKEVLPYCVYTDSRGKCRGGEP